MGAPVQRAVVLVATGHEEVTEARRRLASIGRETLAGWAGDGSSPPWARSERGHYRVQDFRQLAERCRHEPLPRVLDVRFPYEWRRGHIRGASNVPVPEIASASPALPEDEEIWVHCAGGYRAAIAASLLSANHLRPC